ncbi:MAG: glycoside hydrolase family 2 TIM barrel-domain containing protein [Saprospiraceae bacterium]
MYKHILIVFLVIITTTLSSQDNLIQNVYNRNTTTLNGKWHYIIDPYETGYYNYRWVAFDSNENQKHWSNAYYNNAKANVPQERIEYNFDLSPTLAVPGDWNSQDDKLLYYEGTIWCRRMFDHKKVKKGKRVFIHFGAVNYKSEVYLNGEKLGIHIGGFTPFNYEVTDLLKETDNYLIVKVDNSRSKDAVPTLNTDWWNYGGITRDVQLIETAATYVKDYSIQLDNNNPQQIIGYVTLDGMQIPKNIIIEIPELSLKETIKTNGKHTVKVSFKRGDMTLWTPDNPKLYDVTISTSDDAKITDHIGFRTIEVKGIEILLNGIPIFLKGICMHEENPISGRRNYSDADALVSLSWAKELNCNFMRLAHYPHNEYMVKKADEMGMLIWDEIPVYWTINFHNEETLNNAKNQLTEMISRDENRASVIIWSMANEIPETDQRNKFLTTLIDHTRAMDGSRLVSAALQHHTEDGVNIIDDKIAKKVDVVSFNQYVGWYGGKPSDCPNVKWKFTRNKPVIISEFGAGALAGLHGDKSERWTEEYQEYLYEQTLIMLDKIENLRGISPWILADFRSPKRNLPIIQDGWNRKGLLSNTGNKKLAFYTLQKWYESK